VKAVERKVIDGVVSNELKQYEEGNGGIKGLIGDFGYQ
jgi:hypothetical protein